MPPLSWARGSPHLRGRGRAARDEEDTIAGNGGADRSFADAYAAEDEVLLRARDVAREMRVTPVAPGCGGALSLLAAAVDARAVAEIGTGTGVSGVYLLRGMRPDGVLTTVDLDPENQRLARETFTAAGFPGGRARFIPGPALEVLPRLADGGYDLVFCDAEPQEYADYLVEALRLLRPGGIVAFAHALLGGRVPDPARRDPDTAAMREVGRLLRDDERLRPLLLPLGDGLLAAVKLP